MVKIYTICDTNIPFEMVSVTDAIINLSLLIKDCEVICYDWNQALQHKLDADNSTDAIYLADIGKAQHAGISSQEIRNLYPNGKIVVLASDTHAYQDKYQWGNPTDIDLHLDLMPQFAALWHHRGLKTDVWKWTISSHLYKTLTELSVKVEYPNKKYDFIGVYHPYTIQNYRKEMIDYLQDNGYSFTRGNGNGHNDNQLSDLFEYYQNSWFTLGTTSHNDQRYTKIGSMKGFRDWIGPCLNCPLIYDSHPNVVQLFDTQIPLYRYGDFKEITNICDYYKNNIGEYENLIKTQKEWALNNTIDKQLFNLLMKHKIII
jgi:hypothetical protein